MRKLILLIGLFSQCLVATSQGYQEVRSRMMETYRKAHSFSADMEMKTIDGNDERVIAYAEMVTAGQKAWYKWGDIEVMVNENSMVSIQHHLKNMIVADRPETILQSLSFQSQLYRSDSLMAKWIDRVVLAGENEQELHYQLEIPESSMRVEIYVQKNDYLMSRIRYTNNLADESVQTEIAFFNQRINHWVSKELFSLERYVEKKGDFWVGNDRFKNYYVQSN